MMGASQYDEDQHYTIAAYPCFYWKPNALLCPTMHWLYFSYHCQQWIPISLSIELL